MTYMKPEMEIEKFDLIAEITAGEVSAADAPVSGGEDGPATNGAAVVDSTVGSDLIIG